MTKNIKQKPVSWTGKYIARAITELVNFDGNFMMEETPHWRKMIMNMPSHDVIKLIGENYEAKGHLKPIFWALEPFYPYASQYLCCLKSNWFRR